MQTPAQPKKKLLTLAIGALFVCAGQPAQAQSGITDLGDAFGGTWSRALGVSGDGSVVVGWADDVNGDQHAFRWTQAGGMINLGNLGGGQSWANGISADGLVAVGSSYLANHDERAFRWTQGGGMIDLGTLDGSESWANAVSANGSVVVGGAMLSGNASYQAFRWVLGATADGSTSFDTTGSSGGAMVSLGTLGGTFSTANGVSADGSVVVGWADAASGNTYAFRWVLGAAADGTTSFDTTGNSGGAMIDLGTLNGDASAQSTARGISGDGSVVVGEANDANGDTHAFRWVLGATANGATSFDTAGNGMGAMFDLGTLGTGTYSWANAASADGSVVVGGSYLVGQNGTYRAFRWTQATGMQSVENWLRAAGVTVPVDITRDAYGTNSDGSVVVGRLQSDYAFIARVSSAGSGLVTLADIQTSLGAADSAGRMALTTANTVLNGAHSRPLARRVGVGQKTFWLAGDWGRDDHQTRNGDLGLAEVGLGKNYGSFQINVSLGQTWAKQTLALNGDAKVDGTYLLAEALVPVAGNLWAVLGGYGHWGDADLKRGYLNAGAQDYSSAKPGVDTWGLRARLELDKSYRVVGADLSPYADLSYSEARLDAYTESGGGFPARFDASTDKATELRLGVNADKPLANGMNLFGTLEAAHRFEQSGARTSGEMIGLFAFSLDGQHNKQDWLRVGAGVEGKLAEGIASVSLNLTTQGEAPNAWLAASWRKAF